MSEVNVHAKRKLAQHDKGTDLNFNNTHRVFHYLLSQFFCIAFDSNSAKKHQNYLQHTTCRRKMHTRLVSQT